MGEIYNGTVMSPLLSGETRLAIEEDGLIADALFQQEAVGYKDIERIALEDYQVKVFYKGAELCVSRLGNACEWFYRELTSAYNKKVLEALLEEGSPDFETKGGYSFNDGCDSDEKHGEAEIRLYENCICLLPANCDGRRIPFLFINGIREEDFALYITLSTGEQYRFDRLGYDLDPFKKQIEAHIRAMQERNGKFAERLCDSLGFAGAVNGGRLMPESIAVSLDVLTTKLPELGQAVEKKIKNSKMREAYPVLRELCDGTQLAVGVKELPEEEVEVLKEKLLEQLSEKQAEAGEAELTPEQEDALRWILWVAIPSKDGRTAIVEFAFPGEDAATYVFDTGGDWQQFLAGLNRSLEAVNLGREVIYLPEDELTKEKYSGYQMALVRTPALRRLRGQFKGRIIHRSAESWKKGIIQHLSKK